MMRDGVLNPATSEYACAPDVTAEAQLRAQAIAPLVAHRGALTGLAALWVWGCVGGPCPTPLDVAVPRGSHPDPPPRTTARDWGWHTDSSATALALVLSGIGVCSPADAVVAALRTADLGLAIDYSAAALLTRLCTRADVDHALARAHPNARGRARATAAWRELRQLNFEAAALRQ